jgi:dimethylamine monooxygenase subunit A
MSRYFPFASGRYEVAPGLARFGKDFGNGAADHHVFQIDDEFSRYRATKLAGRRECFDRYICEARMSDEVRAAVAAFIIERLLCEHAGEFHQDAEDGGFRLHCKLTGERLRFDAAGGLVDADADVRPAYRDALDALACQIQEDLAVVRSDAEGGHWLSYLHLCCPNHWAAGDKIGRDFADIHAPVAGIESINRRADVHVKTMIAATEGLVRFAWGLATDDELDHHPDRDVLTAARRFDAGRPRAFVRVERQTLWGFPAVGAALFTIRTSFIDCAELKSRDPDMCAALATAIESMSAESIQYKGLGQCREPLLAWLRSG